MACRCSVGSTVTVLYRGLQPPGNVFYHTEVSSYRSTHSYFWVVCRCSVGTTVTITSVIYMYCTEVCSHLVMSFITIKSLHMDLLIHTFLGGMQMFCGHNCNYNICNYVLYRGLRPPGNVFYHNNVSLYGSIHSCF